MGSNELIITELVFNNQLTERPPEEIAALLSRKVLTNSIYFSSGQDKWIFSCFFLQFFTIHSVFLNGCDGFPDLVLWD
jgi:hypothetical protein